ncbi:MAG: hypothetical protein ACLFTV_13920 [Desulfococcaceae bacterium]
MAVLSGITAENQVRVVKKAESVGFRLVDMQEEDGWAALCVRRTRETGPVR